MQRHSKSLLERASGNSTLFPKYRAMQFQARSCDTIAERRDDRRRNLLDSTGKVEARARLDRGGRGDRRGRPDDQEVCQEGRLTSYQDRSRSRNVRKTIGRRRKSLHGIVVEQTTLFGLYINVPHSIYC